MRRNIFLIYTICLFSSLFSGCNKLTEPEKLRPYYVGKWELDGTDSSHFSMLHKQWLTLNDDQTFNCTSSFFWRNDSLKFLPLIGHWDVDEYYINPSHGETRNEITFKVDSIQKTWDIFGETTTSMYWYNDLGYFHWQIVK